MRRYIMRRLLLIIGIILTSACAYGQSGEVYLSVAMPQNSIMDKNEKTLLKNKLLNTIATQGVAATECSAIAMVPELSIMSEEKVEGMMRTIYTHKVSITVTVRNIITNTVFNSIQITSDGEGYSVAESLRSAINKIDMTDGRYAAFVSEAKSKIVDYYNCNTSSLIKKANALSAQQQYDEALALLSTYPESLSGYSEVAKTIGEIFSKSQSKYCGEIMQSARAAYATRDFASASEIVSMINPQSRCAAEARQLLAQIKRDTDKEYRDQIATEREQFRTQAALERERMQASERVRTASIRAARDIATAYYKRQTHYVWFW